MRRKVRADCVSCGKRDLSRNEIGINQKLLGEEITAFYCLDCLAAYLDVTVEDIEEKIEEFREEGCALFE